ncbi:acyl-CoA thioesterase [Microlunatus elymi]|uniref:Acyl-CoA thioesterase n=1 Tax=Microlunatus elymi TaxID=2596828 RepID=A0A516PXF7_9ACTN|nr:acyl-CoA thioesterase [Microlunatus elymi]QDP95864.1 acyl-CoA thioesterase [Microlunatus elymi]
MFQYQVPKRFTDLNAGGHVDHGVLIDYLQEARTEFLLSAPGPVPAMLDSGVLVTGHWVEYLAPIAYRTPTVDAEVWVDQVGGARFSISYRLSDDGVPVALARTFCVPYDLEVGELRRLAADERALLTQAVAEPVSVQPLGKVKPTELAQARPMPLRVRWADLDSYRHVNNVKFFDYFGQARLELIAGAGPLRPGDPWVVARQDLDYRLPIDFRREPYQVRTGVARVGTSSCEFVADIVDPADRRCFATARSVLVSVDEAGRPEPITEPVRKLLTARQASD